MSSDRNDALPPLPQHSVADAEGWERCEHLSKSEAERLLDWLEANGYSQREVFPTADGAFAVRWRPPKS